MEIYHGRMAGSNDLYFWTAVAERNDDAFRSAVDLIASHNPEILLLGNPQYTLHDGDHFHFWKADFKWHKFPDGIAYDDLPFTV